MGDMTEREIIAETARLIAEQLNTMAIVPTLHPGMADVFRPGVTGMQVSLDLLERMPGLHGLRARFDLSARGLEITLHVHGGDTVGRVLLAWDTKNG